MSFNPENYQFLTGEHNNRNVIFVHFSYNSLLKNELKEKFPTVRWSTLKKCWYLPDIKAIRNEIGMVSKTEIGKAVISQIHPVNLGALKRMHETLLLKAYSPNGMGLRVSEIVNLKITNIDSGRMLVHIENAKGKKDRYVTLPSSIVEICFLKNAYTTTFR